MVSTLNSARPNKQQRETFYASLDQGKPPRSCLGGKIIAKLNIHELSTLYTGKLKTIIYTISLHFIAC